MAPNADHSNQQRASIDNVVEANVQELQRLANFYHQRGDYARADELTEVVTEIRRQMAARYESNERKHSS
jgi:hypothetical protein